MISLKGHRIVDLTWELVSRVTRMDQTIEEGQRDVYNMPWICLLYTSPSPRD